MANRELNSRVYCGQVMHHRFSPKRHRFVYSVFSLLLDLDELQDLPRRVKGFSLNRFNLFSLHEKDHGAGQGQLRDEIECLLRRQGYGDATARILLLCYPRILGYVFNPLSVYFCYDSQQHLAVVIYEVSNTFGERHSYLIKVDEGDRTIRQQCSKSMYVSPFTPPVSDYNFRIQPPAARIAVCISQLSSEQRLLHATFTGKAENLGCWSAVSLFFRYPMMTLKVIGAIHWEALRLWLKGVPVYRHESGHRFSVSWQDKDGVRHYEII
ncbi:DUF1365 domain-containing protein [Marinobacterium zhoushanense]|uniref:DUF1365 domain-containing protein n=1 Tax=Marinobacterium zhoushanense TaxID=1679163 RepID=A0ABQ1KC21_9GAMM|nr:DUF1365 domain-containing protein [Marinobacterium zhoushanense]GGB91829.1 DUF1365 domain-containing protein [Marinobacterium zhoushanense]